jgi:phosphatidylglycerophosphate synthase
MSSAGDAVPVERPARPTIAQIREVGQPPAVRGRRNSEHWVADVYLRAISPYLTRILLRTPITANGVTWLMVATGAGAAFALLIPGLPGSVLAALLGQLQMLWDCSDGEVARWRQTTSPKGVFIDRVGHYTAEGLIPIALGMRAAGFPDAGWLATPWPFIGALLSVIVLYNKSLNDMVHVSRAYNGLPRLEEKASVAAPRASGLRRVRAAARFVPFHRAYHSVELTLLALVASVVDLALGDLAATRVLVAALTLLGVVTVIGHLASILSSSRLRGGEE